MIIEYFGLKRFGGHESIEFNCNNPVVGVFGLNGAGKSTVLEGLKFAITGETENNLNTYVKDLEGTATVNLRFRKGGRVGTIERNIGKKTTRSLQWDGRNITAAKEVNALMAEIFGADKKAIANAVFISQGTMSNVLFSGQSDRRDSFIELLNLSFCAGRADMLNRKISKVQATIVDLTPVRDAAVAQRNAVADDYLTKKQTFEASYSWQPEVVYLAKTDTARTQRQIFQTQLSQIETEQQMKSTNLTTLLGMYQFDSVPACSAALQTSQAKLKALEDALATVQSVRAELSHYDRVSNDLKVVHKEMAEISATILKADPNNLGREAWYQTKNKLEQYSREIGSKKQWKRQLQDAEAELIRLRSKTPKVPEFSSPMLVAYFLERSQKATSALTLQRKNFETQKEIAACFESGVLDGKVKCPKCDLTITDANRLSPQELQSMAVLEQDMLVAQQRAEQDYQAKKDTWDTYSRDLQFNQGLIESAKLSIAKAEVEIALFPAYDDVLIAFQLQEAVDAITALQVAEQQMGPARKRMSAKLAEKNGYLLAIKHLADREAFSDTRVQGLTEQKAQEAITVDNLLQKVQTLENIQRDLARLHDTRIDRETQIAKCDAIINTEFQSEQLQALATSMPDSALLRVEVTARNQAWLILEGQLVQLKGTYDAANKAFYEIEDRMAKDIKKRELIADMLKLKELLTNDGLPLSYSRLQFERLASSAQVNLATLNANFAIEIDRSRDLSFTFKRLDKDSGVELPMSSLSGGQRVRLCVAFLIAVQKQIVPDVGLLVLDEPTTSVDAEGRAEIASFLAGMGKELQNTEMQVWVSDHSSEVRNQINCKLEL